MVTAGLPSLAEKRQAFLNEALRCSLHINHLGGGRAVHPDWYARREHCQRMAQAILPAQMALAL